MNKQNMSKILKAAGEEFDQREREMIAEYDKKKVNMSNKHPHHKLIAQWSEDMSKNLVMITENGDLRDMKIGNVIADVEGDYEFKIKPREFVKGHWYPCVDDDSGMQILMFTGSGFSATSRFHHEDSPNCFHSIGESLGEINFK